MKLETVKWAGVEGGQYDSLEPNKIPKNAWARAYNFLPGKGQMTVRAGSAPFGKTAPPISGATTCFAVKNLHAAPVGFDGWALLVLSKTCEVALVNGAGVWGTPLTKLPGGSVPTDEMPWTVRQRNGIVYAVRRYAGGIKRIEGDVWTGAGRPAPSAAGVTVTPSGTGGSLSNNAYRVGYSLYDEVTGLEGNGTLLGTYTTGGGSGKLAVTGLQAPSADVKYTHFQMYLSQPAGATLYASTLVPKASTSVDLTADPTSSQTMPTRMGLPPTDAVDFEIWGERGWVVTPRHLYYSDFGKIEGYSAVQDLPFQPDDNDEMTAVCGWGNYLVVAKRRAMVLLEGQDLTTFQQALWTDMAGCVAPHSMKDCEGELVWLSEDGFCSATAGGPPRLISDTTVKKALAQMDRTRMDLVVADTLPDLKLYVALYPLSGPEGLEPWGGVAYNWQTKAWSEFSLPKRPLYIYTGFDATGAVRVFALCADAAQPYVVFEGSTDDGAELEAELVSLSPDTGGPKLAGVRSVSLLTAPTRYPIEVKVYRDGDTSTPIDGRTVRFKAERGWKRINLAARRLATELQVAIRYKGADPFWVSDMTWDVVQTGLERPAARAA